MTKVDHIFEQWKASYGHTGLDIHLLGDIRDLIHTTIHQAELELMNLMDDLRTAPPEHPVDTLDVARQRLQLMTFEIPETEPADEPEEGPQPDDLFPPRLQIQPDGPRTQPTPRRTTVDQWQPTPQPTGLGNQLGIQEFTQRATGWWMPQTQLGGPNQTGGHPTPPAAPDPDDPTGEPF